MSGILTFTVTDDDGLSEFYLPYHSLGLFRIGDNGKVWVWERSQFNPEVYWEVEESIEDIKNMLTSLNINIVGK